MKEKIIIIGAGPAGLFAAIHAAGIDNEVIVLEKNAEPGKKLLISGSGQCNLTHSGELRTYLIITVRLKDFY